MLYFLYRALSSLLPFIATLNLLRRSRREPAYRRRIKERFGYTATNAIRGPLWIHAVSVGEVIASESLIRQLLHQIPELPILITTTTPAGSAEVERRFGDHVNHCYMPFDAVRCLRRFIRSVQPRALVLMETELWPNLIHVTRQNNIEVILVNARLSVRSARRYALAQSLTKRMLDHISLIISQYEDTAERFIALGFPRERMRTTGNVKFDLEIDEATRKRAVQHREQWRESSVRWIAASTHPGEEKIALDAHVQVLEKHPDSMLIVVPRHPHRAPNIQALAQARALSVATLSTRTDATQVMIIDQMGILLEMYGAVDVAFIGGSLQGTGGHNPVEAAIFGIPMLMGPDRMNFEEVCKRFSDARCMKTVQNSTELAAEVLTLFDDAPRRQRQGEAARRVIEMNQGATRRQFEILHDWLAMLS